MTGGVAVALVFGLLLRPPAQENGLSMRCELSETEVEFGSPFSMTVTRSWPADWEAEPWDDRKLAPLHVVQQSSSQRQRDGIIEETRVFQAFAFELGDLPVAPAAFRAVPPQGSAIEAEVPSFQIQVRSSLGDATVEEVEFPELQEPRPAKLWWPPFVAVILGGAVLWIWSRRWRGPRSDGFVIRPEYRAFQRIERLRKQQPKPGAAHHHLRAFHDEASQVLRDYLHDQWDLASWQRTSEELLDAPATHQHVPTSSRATLERSLQRCDRARFSATFVEPSTSALLDDLFRFVQDTAASHGTDRSSEGAA